MIRNEFIKIMNNRIMGLKCITMDIYDRCLISPNVVFLLDPLLHTYTTDSSDFVFYEAVSKRWFVSNNNSQTYNHL